MFSEIESLERILSYNFKDKSKLLLALSHKSFDSLKNYERLEFIGDKVIGFYVTKILINKFPTADQGELTDRLIEMVRGETLTEIALEMKLDNYIRYKDHNNSILDQENKIRDSILEDVCESVVGAIFIDGEESDVTKVIDKYWLPRINKNKSSYTSNYRSMLQELSAKLLKQTPRYEIISKEGVDHAPTFNAKVSLANFAVEVASGASKSEALTEASKKILSRLLEYSKKAN